MANKNAPFGLRAVAHLTGGTPRTREYTIASGLANNIDKGDLVLLVGTADNKNIDAGDQVGDAPFVGVFDGCSYQDTDGNMQFRRNWVSGTATLGSKDAVALVYDDPWIIFEIQGDGTGALTHIGKNADIAYTAGTNGFSRTELSTSDIGSNDNLYIYGWRDDPNLVKTGANPIYQVLINEHAYRNVGLASFNELS